MEYGTWAGYYVSSSNRLVSRQFHYPVVNVHVCDVLTSMSHSFSIKVGSVLNSICPIHKHMYIQFILISFWCECGAYWLYGILRCHVLFLLHFCLPVCGIRHPSHLSWRPVGGDRSKQDCLVYEDTRPRWDRLIQQVTIWCAPVIRDSLRKCEDIYSVLV